MLNDIYLNNSIALGNVNTFKLMLPIIFHIKQRAPATVATALVVIVVFVALLET